MSKKKLYISIMGKRKYPIVKDTWVYGHITPDGMIYIGYSCCDKCWKRWKPTLYYYSELQLYIYKFGWDNIKHVVFKDGLTEEQGRLLEGLLINQAMKDGWSINKIGSGGLYCDGNNDKYLLKGKNKEYMKAWYEANREQQLEYAKAYRETHKEERKAYRETHKEERKAYREENQEKIREQTKAYYKTHKDEILEYQKVYHKQRRSTPEGKIYYRVASYNHNHPDLAIETPKEAKQKYLDLGYIPSYIKNNDLI